VLLHVDTDFGGDPDDACALVMLLGWPDVELAGVTTCLEAAGQRAGCVRHYLDLAGRRDVPVAAGATRSLTTGEQFLPTWGDERYWPTPVPAEPSPSKGALDLLDHSIQRGATIVAIGALTNLALLERARPGALRDAEVVAMAGWLSPPADGLPDWGPQHDFNVQCDTRSAEIVIAAARVTFVTLPTAMHASLRRRDLERLRASGVLGALLAMQSETYAADAGMAECGLAHAALPDDLVNFHWDPVTAAVAARWSGASIDDAAIRAELDAGTLVLREDEAGRHHRVVTEIDADGFTEMWLASVEAADRAAVRPVDSSRTNP
jgi:inosine-uridine nucleoside N-ribohydrolase